MAGEYYVSRITDCVVCIRHIVIVTGVITVIITCTKVTPWNKESSYQQANQHQYFEKPEAETRGSIITITLTFNICRLLIGLFLMELWHHVNTTYTSHFYKAVQSFGNLHG